MPPAADVAKFTVSFFPANVTGLVISSPPFIGARMETKPSNRSV